MLKLVDFGAYFALNKTARFSSLRENRAGIDIKIRNFKENTQPSCRTCFGIS